MRKMKKLKDPVRKFPLELLIFLRLNLLIKKMKNPVLVNPVAYKKIRLEAQIISSSRQLYLSLGFKHAH